jgi:hypothetical protein
VFGWREGDVLDSLLQSDAMASLDMKAEIERAQSMSTELELMIHNRQPIPLQGNRKYLIAGYWALMVDFHRSVLLLLKPDVNLCGGGFALARPMIEALLRIHLVAMGTDEQVELIRTDKFRTNFEGAAEQIDQLFALDFFAKTFDKRVRDALHSYTHSGAMQVARRFDGNNISPSYKPEERFDVVRMTTLAFAMGTVIITASLGFHPEHTRANEICAEYATKPCGA